MTQEPEQRSVLDRLGPRGIVAIIVGILVIVFIAENTKRVKIRFIAGPEVSTPVWLALVIAAAFGALAGYLVQFLRSRD
jgi:uncharacterized integral membrane protein